MRELEITERDASDPEVLFVHRQPPAGIEGASRDELQRLPAAQHADYNVATVQCDGLRAVRREHGAAGRVHRERSAANLAASSGSRRLSLIGALAPDRGTARYIIHRGQHEIGGMCIEVAADDGTRILLDLGMPLYAPDGGDFPCGTPQRPTAELLAEGVLRRRPRPLPGRPDGAGVAAIVLTHSHLDHYGLAHHAHPAIPVYGSEGTIAILEVGRVFFPDAALPADLRAAARPTSRCASAALVGDGDPGRPRGAGLARAARRGRRPAAPLHRRPARARAHRLPLRELLARRAPARRRLAAPRGHDAGLVGRHARAAQRGRRRGAARRRWRAASPDKLVAVAASGQNLDRLVSCFRAARRSGRLLVIDPYQAYVLMQLAPLSRNIPQFTWEGVRVSFAPHQVERLKAAGLMDLAREMSAQGTGLSDELAADPGALPAVRARQLRHDQAASTRSAPANVVLVWSMWSGYWKRDGCAMREWAEREGRRAHFIHSGGHAWPEDLQRLDDGDRGARRRSGCTRDCAG